MEETKKTNRKLHIGAKGHSHSIRNALVVDKLNAIEWVVLGMILTAIYLTLFYDDNFGMFLTYFWANDNFFDWGSLRFLGNNQMSYGVIQQWFGELWVLPTNIAYRIHEFAVTNAAMVLWFKLSMPFVLTLCMAEMIKTAEILEISKERCKWMMILFASSVLVALPVFHIAQTDILYAYLIMLGVNAYLRGNWKRFILFFAMAISCKVIAVFVFVPLVLLREKRIFFIARDVILGVIIWPLERVWYKIVLWLDSIELTLKAHAAELDSVVEVEDYQKVLDQANDDFFSHFFNKMLYFEFPAVRKGYLASLLVTLFVLLCIYCYIQKKEDTLEWKNKSIYVAMVAWMIFFVNASPSPYWIVAMYPILFLAIFTKPMQIRVNLLLTNVFTLTMFLVYVMNTGWVYGGSSNLDYLLLKGLLKPGHISVTDQGPCVVRYLNNLGVNNYMNIVTAICLASAIAIVVINNHKVKIDEELSEGYEKMLMHGMAIWQIGFLGVWYLINVWVVSRW